MKTALLAALTALWLRPASAAPLDMDSFAAQAAGAGFALPSGGFPAIIAPRLPPPARVAFEPQAVALAGLLDRHWTGVDWFDDSSGRTYAAGTLDYSGTPWLVVSPPGLKPMMIKVERGMSARWTCGGRNYEMYLDVSIFRARLNNLFVIRDADGGRTLWRSRIIDLFRRTEAAGEAVTLFGAPYRLFVSRLPSAGGSTVFPSQAVGICLVYDGADAPDGSFESYRFLLSDLESGYRRVQLHGGQPASVSVSPDGSSLLIAP